MERFFGYSVLAFGIVDMVKDHPLAGFLQIIIGAFLLG